MPRPLILRPGASAPAVTVDAAHPVPAVGTGLQAGAADGRLQMKRSPRYISAMATLDAGAHVENRAGLQQLVDALRQEFPEVAPADLPEGILARCHLGLPFDVHSLDCAGGIVTHYKMHEPLPSALASARALALHPSYAFVEIYTRSLRAVRATGEVVTIPR